MEVCESLVSASCVLNACSALCSWLACLVAAQAVADDDCDDGLDGLFEAVAADRRGEDHIANRGPTHMRIMRLAKEAVGRKRDREAPKVAPHVAKQIDDVNRDFVVTEKQVIDPNETKRRRIKGTGSWRRWVASAVLRVCFGYAEGHLLESKNQGDRLSLAMSSRGWAAMFQASHATVQAKRDAISELYLQGMKDSYVIGVEPDIVDILADTSIAVLSFDETEEPIHMSAGPQEKQHIMMSHFSLHSRFEDFLDQREFVQSPAALADTTAACIFAALLHVLAVPIELVVSRSKRSVRC